MFATCTVLRESACVYIFAHSLFSHKGRIIYSPKLTPRRIQYSKKNVNVVVCFELEILQYHWPISELNHYVRTFDKETGIM